MALQYTKEQKMLRALVKEFADKEVGPRAAEMDRNESMDPTLLKMLGDLGFMGLGIPVEYGGAGMGMMEKSIVVEELARKDAATAEVMSVHNMAYLAILKHGSEELKQKFLPIAAKGGIAAFALTEPSAGSDAAGVQTTAVADGDDYIINGSKCFISNMGPQEGSFVTVLVSTDPSKGSKGFSAIVVERGTPGFTIGKREEKLGIRAADVSELIFEDCRVPKANLVGAEGKGFGYFMEALDSGRIGMASQALGIAEEALDLSIEYLKVRVQFGKPLSKQQGLQWYLADMGTKVEAARALIYEAASDMDRGDPVGKIAAIAKYYASEIGVQVTDKALQLHSGYGYMRDYPLERMYRDARIIPIYEGTSEIQKIIISRELLK
ncbi:MAG: acyl-CoA dehydrogenase family protein [Oscillibacter sp.]|jgi:alkylation response protein AidB-like acyl-CoA dehydrogenase|nr:acyl-CoA dehydrogenase family protein [Oscillibacter sp.]